MEDLPAEVLSDIISRLPSTSHRNSLALACKRCYDVERLQRSFLKTGCGLHPMEEALLSLCRRFPNLTTVELSYSGWMSSQGNQLDDHGLALLSEYCPLLINLSLSFCCYVTDAGLGSLSNCSNLRSLKLNFVPRITGIGLLSFVTGCSGIRLLELNRCMYVRTVEWLQFLGTQGVLESLIIRNCRGVGELDLAKLGWGWRALRQLVFEVDGSSYRSHFPRAFGDGSLQQIDVSCELLQVLVLTNCVISEVSTMLSRCSSVLELELNMCVGLRDEQLISLAERCRGLKSLTLRFCQTSSITNATFEALGTYSLLLEKVVMGMECCPLTVGAGIVFLLQGCSSLRELVLEKVDCFNDAGMEAVCSSESLENLQLLECQQVGDKGISGIANSRLRKLRLQGCFGITDAGISSLTGGRKLDVLEVLDCPNISSTILRQQFSNRQDRQSSF